jgi:secreted PhoX family phosphatase
MTINRREFLLFMGATSGMIACNVVGVKPKHSPATYSPLPFKPVKLPLPLTVEGMSPQQQMESFSSYQVQDDLVLPEGYTYQTIATWGDAVGNSRFGYNNDYVSFVATGADSGLLTINFEYISGKTWMQTYNQVIGKNYLPLPEVRAALSQHQGKINAFALAAGDTLKQQIKTIAKEGFIDQGIGVISIQTRNQRWVRSNAVQDRRITGISGLEDGRYLQATGPGVAVFTKPQKLGYEDGLGDRIIGTFQNCAGGTTPWGTVLSAEENFQDQVPEPVMADGSAFDPSHTPFILTEDQVDGRGNPFGLAGNKYGWMVEIDPRNPQDYGTKHTWLGRYRHEAVAIHAIAGQPLAVYSGCDRKGGHLYKFVSAGNVTTPTDTANSRLFAKGMLYGAQLNPDGSGQWIPLKPDTPVDPVLPSQVVGKADTGIVMLPNPDRQQGGYIPVGRDAEALAFKQKFKTLGTLYQGNSTQRQGAILIDAHYAANAAGITCLARPEDTAFDPNQNVLFIAFTSGGSDEEGGPDQQIFQGPNQETPYEHGWIMKIREAGGKPAATQFRWEMIAVGGEPAQGGLGFANPDNLEVDSQGNLWMVTDMSTGKQNLALPSRADAKQSELTGVFGNNTAWYLPLSGANAGKAFPFAIAPIDSELCGLCLHPNQRTLFLAAQHPGEAGGIRQKMATEIRQIALQTTDGQGFMQSREVPIGSNWPGKKATDPPKPAVVAIYRQDGKALV